MKLFTRAAFPHCILLLTVIFLFSHSVSAQLTYYKQEIDLGGDIRLHQSHVGTYDGGNLVVIHSQDTINAIDVYVNLIKTNAAGVIQWIKRYEGLEYTFENVVQSPDSGFFLCGVDGPNSYTVLKTDKYGNLAWTHHVNIPFPYSSWNGGYALAKNDGGFYVGAMVHDYTNSTSAWLLFRLDAGGNVVSSGTYNVIAAMKNYVRDIDTCSNGDVLILGSTLLYGSDYSPTLARISSTTALVWLKAFPFAGRSLTPGAMTRTAGDFIYIANESSLPTQSFEEACLIKIDGNGTVLWALNYSHPAAILTPFAILRNSNGDIMLTGNQMFMKTDSSGIPLCAAVLPNLSCNQLTELGPQEYQFTGYSLSSFRAVMMTADDFGNTCNDSAISVTKASLAVYDTTLSGEVNVTLTVTPDTFRQAFFTLHFENPCLINSIAAVEHAPDWNLFPNPARETVSIQSAEHFTSVSLLDVTGREVLNESVANSQVQLNIAALPPGCYFVRVVFEEHIELRKLVIE